MNKFRSLLQQTSFDDPQQTKALAQLLNQEITIALDPMVEKIETLLKHLGGHEIFDNFHDNREFVHGFRNLLSRIGLRVACPDCGEPAIITCTKGTRSKRGTLAFQHRTDGVQRMHSAVVIFPTNLRLVPRKATRS